MELKKVKQLAMIICLSAFTMASCSDTNTTGDGNGNDTTAAMNDNMNNGNANGSGVADRDEDFVTDVLEANAEEMAWLREGQNMGTDAELKSHAQHMMGDHEKMDQEMRAYASKKNIDLNDLDTDAKVGLNDAKGNEWDEEWADEMADMHEKLIRKFERAQDRVQDAELKDMITKTLPTLRSHLDMATKLEEKLDNATTAKR